MAKSALRALDQLALLDIDSLIFISDEADDRAEAGRDNGRDDAGSHANEAAIGIEIAATAPDGPPADLGLPDSVPDGAGPPSLAGIELFDTVFAAKGGSKGKPGVDGGGGGGGSPTVTASYTSGTLDTYHSDGFVDVDNYNIQIDFYDSLWGQTYTDANGALHDLGEAFIAAATFISSIIAEGANDVYDMLGNLVYDDLVIEAHLIDIDGPEGVLGRAGPTGIRTSDGLTATGLMEFDVADAVVFAELGLWDDIVFHEMMHVLGIGTLWDFNDLLQTESTQTGGIDTKKPTDDVYETTIVYTGAAGIAANDGNTLYVEQDGGSGTAGGHWNEIIWDEGSNEFVKDLDGYENEIMTGFIDDLNYLLAFSVASLADIGYTLVPSLDISGNPVYDDDGNPVLDYAELAAPQNTEIMLVSDTGYDDHLLA
jgi:hypothetical protein